ncbi:BnaA05g09060D [Brassica napus]|uniref:BnaA05g09060D protein n=1 Tax=Brassica napus TaxID=3708 RepID=A0A078H1I2_BRANA|nr:BnaA05g09060D [Brassica napus]
MAANAPPELASGNSCCIAWQGKYLGMKKRRDACKEAIEILQKAMGAANDEKTNLQKKLREMSDSMDTKENDSGEKGSLEKEVSDLKSEKFSLQQRLERNIQEKSEEIKILRDQASSREKEISELKNLLKKETSRADNSEEEREQVCKELNKAKALLVKYEDIKPDVPELKEEINLVKSLLVSERQKAESERKKAESEKKRAVQYLSELEVLRATAHKTSSDLLTSTSTLETLKKQLESEKQKTLKERKRADMESAKAKEQMKLAEGLSKKFEIIRVRNEELKKEAELQTARSKVKFAENSAKLEEKMRLLEMNKKTAMDWKSRVDDLTRQLQESQLVTEGLKKQVHELSLSRKSTRSVSPHEARDLEKAEMRLLKKELKFQKKREKHFNEVAEFEKYRREFQAEELGRLKREFGGFTNRMNLLGEYFSRDVEGTAALAKVEGRRKPPKNRSGENNSDARCHLGANPGSQDQACKFSAQLIAKAGRGVSESVSDPISQLDSPTGGSRELLTSGVVSSAISFSEGELLASQGREQFAFTTTAENIQPTKSSMFQKVDTGKNGKLCFVAENCVQSGQKDRHEVVNEHSRKRKRLSEAMESLAGKTMCLSTAKGHDAATLFLEEDAATDYMKLLELDQPEDEIYYKIARESLMSPDLPQVNFLGDEIMNEDKNPTTALDLVASSEAYSLNTENASVTVKMPPESPTSDGHILKHFVVFSNTEDQNSIIKIFHAANSCAQRCPSVATAQWAVPAILFSLKMEDNLLARERACVFLSLLLHNFSMVSSMNIGNTLDHDSCACLDSFSKHICSVMADTEAGGILTKFLEELLSLLKALLSEQRVLYSAKSSETTESGFSIHVTLNGENVALFSRVALTDHLVAGSAILAAICTAVDRVGLIREVSFELLHRHSHEKTPVPLTILHVFAYIAGEKMMSSSDHNISNAVLKSIVMFLENRHFGTVEGSSKLHPGKNKCPFSDKSSSLEAMGSMLMEIVQEFAHSNTVHQSLIEFRPAHKGFQCVLGRDQSVTLYDILSLVDLIACYTAWNWTSANIVSPLLKTLGMPLPTNVSVAVISLLGQLSSIGVDAGGYENEGISNLREKLSSFLQCETTLEAGFGVQIATVSSLLKTLQLDLAIVFQGETTKLPDCGDQSSSVPANMVAKWFSLLSDEQRAFATEFLQTCC